MNIKGTAAGGGKALLIPMTEFSLGLTGDINDITNAHNLAMVALNARMQHERNYDDAELAKRKLKRLDIDSTNIEMGWVMDFCAQGLRNIIMGIGGGRVLLGRHRGESGGGFGRRHRRGNRDGKHHQGPRPAHREGSDGVESPVHHQ